MKVGFDAKRAFFNKTGLGNYSRTVIKSLCELFPDSYFLYTPKRPESNPFKDLNVKIIDPFTPLVPKTEIASINPNKVPVTSNVIAALWRSFFVTHRFKQDGIDLFHGLSHELPFNIKKSRIPSIVTVHDLIFMRFSQYYRTFDRMMYKIKLKRSCKNADRIIAISHQTKEDLIKLLNVPKEKISVVYQSCDEQFYTVAGENVKNEVRKKYNLPAQFLLNVGTIEERKNLLVLIKALNNIPAEKSLPLVVIGKKTAYSSKIEKYISENKLQKDVLFLKNVDFDDLPAIYRSAELFVYPSRFEGFGLPIVEALLSKIPVITSNSCGCLKEAGGPDTVYFEPDNDRELAEKILAILNDKALQNKMTEHGEVYAQRFKKEIVTKNLMMVYKQVVND